MITHLDDTDGLTLLIGAFSLILVLALKRWLPLIPGSLVAVLLGILAVSVFGLDEKGVKIVGHIDSGLPVLGLPSGLGWRDYLTLPGPAIGVLLIGFAEETKVVVLDAETSPFVDVSAATMLVELKSALDNS